MKKLTIKQIQDKSDQLHHHSYKITGEYVDYNSLIEIKHLKCGYVWNQKVSNHLSGKGCPKCAGNKRLTILEIQEKSNTIHDNSYQIIEKNKDRIKIKHLKCEFVWNTSQRSHLNNKTGCPKCLGGIKLDINLIKDKLKEYQILEEYKNIDSPIKVKHINCGYIWKPILNNILNKKTGCPNCFGNRKLTNDEVISQIPSDYLLLEKYKSMEHKHQMKHLECGYIWDVNLKHFVYNYKRCPKCQMSKGERLIMEILDSRGIDYIHQYKNDECKNIKPLSFDFYLPLFDIYIEFDGIQHFEPIVYFGGLEKFKELKVRDSIKDNFTKERLFRISYKDNIISKMNDIFKILNF